MALVIEDGSIVAGADSFVTRADYIAYAAGLGITVENTEAADVQLRTAVQFMASRESRLKGVRVSRDQPLPYPRSDLVLDGFEWSSTEIPRQVLLCQMALALDLNAGIDIYNPPQSGATGIKSERVEGAVTVVYATADVVPLSRRSQSQALMSSLMRDGGLLSISVSMA
jgi:hypothetical protein